MPGFSAGFLRPLPGKGRGCSDWRDCCYGKEHESFLNTLSKRTGPLTPDLLASGAERSQAGGVWTKAAPMRSLAWMENGNGSMEFPGLTIIDESFSISDSGNLGRPVESRDFPVLFPDRGTRSTKQTPGPRLNTAGSSPGTVPPRGPLARKKTPRLERTR